MATLSEGSKAPEFALPASDGKQVSLRNFRGKRRVVLYFYPKDNTSGCTVEACAFRDSVRKIERQEAVVLGVSPDPVASHRNFVEKFGLPFLLLSDEGSEVCEAYGVWVEKNHGGKKAMGVARTTFVIGKDGTIEKIYRQVKPEGHAEEVLEFLAATETEEVGDV